MNNIENPNSEIYYVLATELFNSRGECLDGEFHLFDLPGCSKVAIHPLKDGRILVTAGGETIKLHKDGSFRIDRYDGNICHIAGPSRYKDNPFRAVMAETVLGQAKIEQNDDPIQLGTSETGHEIDSSLVSIDQIQYHAGWCVDEVTYGKIVVVRGGRGFGPVKRIYVRSDATQEDANILREHLEFIDLLRKPSGAFDAVHKRLQDAEDEEYRIFGEKLAAEEAEKRQKAYESYVNSLLHVTEPKLIQVDGNNFIVNQGKVYNGSKVGGKRLSLAHLFETGKLGKISAAVAVQ